MSLMHLRRVFHSRSFTFIAGWCMYPLLDIFRCYKLYCLVSWFKLNLETAVNRLHVQIKAVALV